MGLEAFVFRKARNGKVGWYARFKQDGRVVKEIAISSLLRLMNEEKPERMNRRLAERIADDAVRKGYVRGARKNLKLLSAYCLEYWDYDGARIKLKNRKKPNSLTRAHARTQGANFRLHILPLLPDDFPLVEMTSKLANQIQDRLMEHKSEVTGRQISNSTIVNAMQSLIGPMNKAYEDGLIPKPIKVDRIDTTPQKRRAILTLSEMKALTAALVEFEETGYQSERLDEESGEYKPVFMPNGKPLVNRLDYDVRLACALAATTGMRLGEICALKLDDVRIVNERDAIIIIDQSFSRYDGFKSPKGRKTRETACPSVVAKELIRHGTVNPWNNGIVFWSKSSKIHPVSANYIRDHYYRALRKIGITESMRKERNIVFHSLRHSYVSFMRGAVMDETLMLAVGHVDARTTDGYTHVTYQNLKPLADKTSDMFRQIK